MAESLHPWAPDGQPFCWQPKAARHRIRDRLESVAGVSSGLVVYDSLTEIASDKHSAVFQSTHAYIAQRSGLSVRTVLQRVKDLAEIGLIRYTVPTLKAPAQYELLPVTDDQPIPRVPQPLPNDAKQLPNDKKPLPSDTQPPKTGIVADTVIIEKESGKNNAKNPIKSVASYPELTPDGQRTVELMEFCKEVLGDEEMKSYHRRWYDRAIKHPRTLRKLLAEARVASIEGKIKISTAAYIEDLWKRPFAKTL